MAINYIPEEFVVSFYSDNDEIEWRKFIHNNENASIYHTLEWKKILEESFGFESINMILRNKNEILEILPLYLIKNPILGKKIISIPISGHHATFLSNNTKAHSLLIKAIVEIAIRRNIKYVEIRTHGEVIGLKEFNFVLKKTFYFPEVELVDTVTNFEMMDSAHRRAIRRSVKKGVYVVESDNINDLKKFYDIMFDLFHDFGTPMFDYKYFENIWKNFKNNNCMKLLIVKHEGDLIGGGIIFLFNNKLIYKYGACKKEYLPMRPYNALLWKAIELGIKNNLQSFNLGGVTNGDDGLMRFKKNWGAKMNQGYFYYYLINGSIPEIEKYIGSYSIHKKFWRVLPKPVISYLGPKITEWIC